MASYPVSFKDMGFIYFAFSMNYITKPQTYKSPGLYLHLFDILTINKQKISNTKRTDKPNARDQDIVLCKFP